MVSTIVYRVDSSSMELVQKIIRAVQKVIFLVVVLFSDIVVSGVRIQRFIRQLLHK